MTLDEFWSVIDTTRTEDPYEHAEAIEESLAKRSAEEIEAFDKHLSELHAASYSWKLWGAAYMINGGCSDDGFDYFRAWLITQGPTVYNNAIEDPDSLADLPDLEDDVECEDALYVARSAYETVTGDELEGVSFKYPDLGEGWDFDDDDEMKQRYPKLFAKFCDE